MTLLEILLHELESWPAGKEYAYQSATTPELFFATPTDIFPDLKAISLCQIASERGIDHKVTRGEWETAKMKSLPFFNMVASALGEERAVKELLAVGKISGTATELDEAFVFNETPQGHEFWKDILEPSLRADKLKQALNVITAAMRKANPGYCIRLQVDGSGSVRDQDDNEIIYFRNADSLVKKYLNLALKFDHWPLLQDKYKWIAKDLDGAWWAYVEKPNMDDDQWESTEVHHPLDILKVDIPCHWKRSLIERPTHSD